MMKVTFIIKERYERTLSSLSTVGERASGLPGRR
jgi:hypothetical protein